jgi:hypothetical protein
MAKSRSHYFADAGQALSRQNLPGVYQNAVPALALGDARAAYLLCVFHYHQMQERAKQGVASPAALKEFINFSIMYQISEHFQFQGYAQFTQYFTSVFSQIDGEIRNSIVQLTAGYMHYLTAKRHPSGEVPIDVGFAKAAVSSMLTETVQYARAHPYKVDAQPKAPHGYYSLDDHGHNPENVPLAGHKHSSDSECCCAIS